MSRRKQNEEAQADIHRIEREQFLTALNELKGKFKNTKFVLIIDSETTPILSSLVTVTELMENQITMIDKYSLDRQPLRSYHAIYLISPESLKSKGGEEDIKKLESDMKTGKYLATHIFLTHDDQEALDSLARHREIVEKLQTLKVIFIHYRCVDPWTFHTMTPNAFNSMYSDTPRANFQQCCESMLSGLTSFFFAIQARPRIVFADKPDKVGIFAGQLEQRLDELQKALSPDVAKKFDTKDTVLVILARGNDAIAPLLHQFTYEANIYDTLKVVDGVLTPDPAHPDEKVTLDVFQDDLFKKVRFVPMTDIGDILKEALSEFTALEKQQKEGATEEIKREALKKIAKRKVERDQAANHMATASAVAGENKERHLADLATYEQNIAVGFAEGKKFKTNGMELSGKINLSGMTEADKVRVLALFNLKVKKFGEAEVGRLLQGASMSPEWKPAVLATSRFASDEVHRDDDRVLEEEAWTHDKYQPLVYEIGKKLTTGAKMKDMEKPKDIGSCRRIVFFILGGVSFMELRWLETLRRSDKMGNRKIYVGGSNILEPLVYLDELKQL